MTVENKDVVVHANGAIVDFPCPTKRRIKGFQCFKSQWLVPAFDQHIAQTDAKRIPGDIFLANLNVKNGTRAQIMEGNSLGKMTKELVTRLGKDPKNYAAKSFCRFSAAQLIEAGISWTVLKFAGNCKDSKTPMKHIENSKKLTTTAGKL